MVTRGARARPHNMSPAPRLPSQPTHLPLDLQLDSFAPPPSLPHSLIPSLPSSLPYMCTCTYIHRGRGRGRGRGRARESERERGGGGERERESACVFVRACE